MKNSNQDPIFKIKQVIQILRRRYGLIVLPMILSLVIGIGLSLTLPRVYESQAVIGIQPQRVSTEFDNPISTGAIDRMNSISQHILSQSCLEKIIKTCNLFSEDQYKHMLLETKIFDLRKRIKIATSRSRNELNSFSISFQGENPESVRNVVFALKSSFIGEIVADGIRDAQKSVRFLDNEQSNIRQQLETVEERLKRYRKKYLKELPEQREAILRTLDRLQNLLLTRRDNLRSARTDLAILEQQIHDRQLNRNRLRASEPVPETPTLETYLQELKICRTKYTEKHPTVIRLLKNIEALKQGKKETAPLSVKPEQAPLPPNAPVTVEYRRTQAEIKALRGEIDEINLQIIENEKILENLPKREQELAKLSRDYQSKRGDYENLSNQKLRAERWLKLVTTYGTDQFITIDPARIPQAPIKPDLRLLFIGTILAGLGIGAGIVYFLEFYNQPVSKQDEIEMLYDLPLIGVISDVTTSVSGAYQTINRVGPSLLMGGSFLTIAGLLGVFTYIVFFKSTRISGMIF